MSQYYNSQRVRNMYIPNSGMEFRLSRSKLEQYIECPKCFYLDRVKGVGRPPGFPFNLNSAVDALLKNFQLPCGNALRIRYQAEPTQYGRHPPWYLILLPLYFFLSRSWFSTTFRCRGELKNSICFVPATFSMLPGIRRSLSCCGFQLLSIGLSAKEYIAQVRRPGGFCC